MHALSHGAAVPPAGVGKEQERMLVHPPVVLELVPHGSRQWQDAILMPLAGTDEKFVLLALDVVDGEGQAFAEAQAADVDEFDGGAIAAQADSVYEIMNLLEGEDCG